jgi:tetratricopeptide (TPR) repeat protein
VLRMKVVTRGSIKIGVVAAPVGAMLVAVSDVSSGQTLKEAQRLKKQVDELYSAGKYAEAIPLPERDLAIREKTLGPDHPDVTTSVNLLALVFHAQGRHADAEPLYKRALKIREKTLGPDHRDVGQYGADFR